MSAPCSSSAFYKDIGNAVATAGIEYYLPLFFEDTATDFDYLGAQATVVLHGDLEPAFALSALKRHARALPAGARQARWRNAAQLLQWQI